MTSRLYNGQDNLISIDVWEIRVRQDNCRHGNEHFLAHVFLFHCRACLRHVIRSSHTGEKRWLGKSTLLIVLASLLTNSKLPHRLFTRKMIH